MNKVFEFLNGKKTYILAAAGAILQGLVFAGFATQDQVNPLLVMLGFTGAATLRSAVK